eukprot:4120591-Pyramimonas_sp.AAC.1
MSSDTSSCVVRPERGHLVELLLAPLHHELPRQHLARAAVVHRGLWHTPMLSESSDHARTPRKAAAARSPRRRVPSRQVR